MGKIHPSFLEVLAPCADEAFDRRARVHLRSERIKDLTNLDASSIVQSGLVDLEGMGVLVNRHRRRETWIKLDGRSPD